MLLELLETEGPTDFALKQVAAHLNGQPAVRSEAHALVRKFGPKAAKLAPALWTRGADLRGRPEDKLDPLATLARIEDKPAKENWERLLSAKDATLLSSSDSLVAFVQRQDRNGRVVDRPSRGTDERRPVRERRTCRPCCVSSKPIPSSGRNSISPRRETDKNALTEKALAALAKLPKPEMQRRTALGRQVFDRTGCTKCHTTVNQNTILANKYLN